jgi:hypothetical protein
LQQSDAIGPERGPKAGLLYMSSRFGGVAALTLAMPGDHSRLARNVA